MKNLTHIRRHIEPHTRSHIKAHCRSHIRTHIRVGVMPTFVVIFRPTFKIKLQPTMVAMLSSYQEHTKSDENHIQMSLTLWGGRWGDCGVRHRLRDAPEGVLGAILVPRASKTPKSALVASHPYPSWAPRWKPKPSRNVAKNNYTSQGPVPRPGPIDLDENLF